MICYHFSFREYLRHGDVQNNRLTRQEHTGPDLEGVFTGQVHGEDDRERAQSRVRVQPFC